MYKTLITYLLGIFILFSSTQALGQENFKNEDAMLKKASKLFEEENYIGAFQYYQTLISNHRDNPDYNFRYGVCLMYSDKRDVARPLHYLEKAIKDPNIDERIWYFIGMAYHMNYRFIEAVEGYEFYKETARNKDVKRYNVERRIEECTYGLELFSEIRLLYVVQKKEVKDYSFYREYEMSKTEGKILMLPKELWSKMDLKVDKTKFAFYIPEDRVAYFSSYGKKGYNGLDIYRANQLPDGSWSSPERLGNEINTPYDDSYPYLADNGKTLYFSSKGHNTMGGYDIFRSSFNLSSFRWATPQNINFPVNTPFDEIYYIPDTLNEFAYFSSNRTSIDGLIHVYKIGVNKRPLETQNLAMALRKGGDIKVEIDQIKQMANLSANVDYEKYVNDIKENSSQDTNTVSQVDVNSIDAVKVQPKEDLADLGLLLDSCLVEFKELKYSILHLKKDQRVVRKASKTYKQKATEYVMAGDNEKFTQYSKNALLVEQIDKEMTTQIHEVERDAEITMRLIVRMQKHMGLEEKDSALHIYKRIQNVYDRNQNLPNLAQAIIDFENQIVEDERLAAQEMYADIQKTDQLIVKLKEEKKEYQKMVATVTSEEEKIEYENLVTNMDKQISKTESAKRQKHLEWLEKREFADSIGKTLALSGEILNEIKSNTGEGDIYTKENIDAVNQEIAAIDINNTYTPDEYPLETQQGNQVGGEEAETQIDTETQVAQVGGEETETQIDTTTQIDQVGSEGIETQIDTMTQVAQVGGEEIETPIDTITQIAQVGGEETETQIDTTTQVAQVGGEEIESQIDITTQVAQIGGEETETQIDTTAQVAQVGSEETENQIDTTTQVAQIGGEEIETQIDTTLQVAQIGGEETETPIDTTAQVVQVGSEETENQIDTETQIAQIGSEETETQIDTTSQIAQVGGEETETQIDTTSQIAQVGGEETEIQIDTTTQVAQVGGEEIQTQIDTTSQVAQIGREETEIQIDTTTQVAQVGGEETETLIDTETQIAQIGSEETETQIDTTSQIAQVGGEEIESQIDTTTQVAQVGGEETETQIDTTAQVAQIGGEETETLIDTETQIAQIGSEETETQIDTTSQIAQVGGEEIESQIDTTTQVAQVGGEETETQIDTTAQVAQVGSEETETQIDTTTQVAQIGGEEIETPIDTTTQVAQVGGEETDPLHFDPKNLNSEALVVYERKETLVAKAKEQNEKNTVLAKASYSLAKDNIELAKEIRQESNQLQSALHDLSVEETTKKEAIAKNIHRLNGQALQLEREAIAVYQLAKEINEISSDRQESKQNVEVFSRKLDSLLQNDVVSLATDELNDFEEEIEKDPILKIREVSKLNYQESLGQVHSLQAEITQEKNKQMSLEGKLAETSEQGGDESEIQSLNTNIELTKNHIESLNHSLAKAENQSVLDLTSELIIDRVENQNETLDTYSLDEIKQIASTGIAQISHQDEIFTSSYAKQYKDSVNLQIASVEPFLKDESYHNPTIESVDGQTIFTELFVDTEEKINKQNELTERLIAKKSNLLNRTSFQYQKLQEEQNELATKVENYKTAPKEDNKELRTEIFKLEESIRKRQLSIQASRELYTELGTISDDRSAKISKVKNDITAATVFIETNEIKSAKKISEQVNQDLASLDVEVSALKDVNESITHKEQALKQVSDLNKQIAKLDSKASKLEDKAERVKLEAVLNPDKKVSLDEKANNMNAEAQTHRKKAQTLDLKVAELELDYKSELLRKLQLLASLESLDNIATEQVTTNKEGNEVLSQIPDYSNIYSQTLTDSTSILKAIDEELVAQVEVETPKSVVAQTEIDSAVTEVLGQESLSDGVQYNDLDYTLIKMHLSKRELKYLEIDHNKYSLLIEEGSGSGELEQWMSSSDRIEGQMDSVETKIAFYQKEISRMEDAGYKANVSQRFSDVDLVVSSIMGNVVRLTKKADSLQANLHTLSRKERKSVSLEVNELYFDAANLESQANLLSSLDKQLKYRANMAALQAMAALSDDIDDVRINKAKTLISDAERNRVRANENRIASTNQELTIDQRRSMIKEAENMELIAIKQQVEAIYIYQDVNPQLAKLNLIPKEFIPSEQTQVAETGTEQGTETGSEQTQVAETGTEQGTETGSEQTQVAETGTEQGTETGSEQTQVAETGTEQGTETGSEQTQVAETGTEQGTETGTEQAQVAETGTEQGTETGSEQTQVAETGTEQGTETGSEQTQVAETGTETGSEQTQIAETGTEQGQNAGADVTIPADAYIVRPGDDMEKLDNRTILKIAPVQLNADQLQKFKMRRADIIGMYISEESSFTESFYSPEKPIQIQNTVPTGLVYKVQIAALRRRINGDLFLGVKPIVGEEIEGSAFIRYMAGLFTEHSKALVARDNIRGKGYRDAFIVAYYNGERISNGRARVLIAQGKAFTDESLVVAAKATQQAVYTLPDKASGQTGSVVSTVAGTPVNGNPNQGAFGEPELFYAVQIGVYGSPRNNSRLNNLPEMYYGRMTNGNYRYFTGKFTDYQLALTRRSFARTNGFADAYIVAYYKGNKVSVSRAQEIQPTLIQTSSGNTTEQNPQVTTPTTTEVRTNTPQVEQSPATDVVDNTADTSTVIIPTETVTNLPAVNLVYKVQIGAYRNQVPLSEVGKLISIASKGLEQKVGDNGLTIFLTGSFDNLSEASKLKNEIVTAGLQDAFVVVYNNGKRISIQEANQLLNP